MYNREIGGGRDRRQETIGGEEDFRSGNRGVGRIEGGLRDREFTGENPRNLRGRRWGVLRADWNGEARARGRNARYRAECQTTTQNG